MVDLDLDFDFDEKEISSNKATKIEIKETKSRSIPIRENTTPVGSKIDVKALSISACEKIEKIKEQLNESFLEREEVIDNCIRALIGGQSMLLLGPPGTAKSELTGELCSRIIGGRYFSWLMNKTTDPSEILGPFSLKEMENDKLIRITKGKLPEAEICFLDEIFKSNDAALNVLLPLLNEKVFYNDGKATKVPLISLYAASNEFPEEGVGLEALYDRLIFRMWVDYLSDTESQKKMFTAFLKKRTGVVAEEKATITLDEIYALQVSSRRVSVNKTIINSFIKMVTQLEAALGISLSDRRLNQCLAVMQVNAVINGRSNVVVQDFLALTYVLWENLDQIPSIEKLLHSIANPFKEPVSSLIKDLRSITATIENYNEAFKATGVAVQEYQLKMIEITGQLEQVAKKAETLRTKIKSAGNDIKEVTAIVDLANAQRKDIKLKIQEVSFLKTKSEEYSDFVEF